ncbi:carbohydrate kinase [Chloroflexi bacterium TSY]|nr:carbohydrate kinase [Chloroflexi bacterium TSY]
MNSTKNMHFELLNVDVLCMGFACHDLVFEVDCHPGSDEKMTALALLNCGGGTASNAAITAARLGFHAAFVGYIGTDIYGDLHLSEFKNNGVNTEWIVRGAEPTPLSAILVKPNGQRTIINYRGNGEGYCSGRFDLSQMQTKSILIDGHQYEFAQELIHYATVYQIPTVIDADSLRPATEQLVQNVDYVVASERFAYEYANQTSVEAGLSKLAMVAPNVVVTLGERGLIWQQGSETGRLNAFSVEAVDTTGAGDAFHGAFAAGLATNMEWPELLRYASAVGALCCTKQGGRIGIPSKDEVIAFLDSN